MGQSCKLPVLQPLQRHTREQHDREGHCLMVEVSLKASAGRARLTVSLSMPQPMRRCEAAVRHDHGDQGGASGTHGRWTCSQTLAAGCPCYGCAAGRCPGQLCAALHVNAMVWNSLAVCHWLNPSHLQHSGRPGKLPVKVLSALLCRSASHGTCCFQRCSWRSYWWPPPQQAVSRGVMPFQCS
jgi:hypothetical protein